MPRNFVKMYQRCEKQYLSPKHFCSWLSTQRYSAAFRTLEPCIRYVFPFTLMQETPHMPLSWKGNYFTVPICGYPTFRVIWPSPYDLLFTSMCCARTHAQNKTCLNWKGKKKKNSFQIVAATVVQVSYKNQKNAWMDSEIVRGRLFDDFLLFYGLFRNPTAYELRF